MNQEFILTLRPGLARRLVTLAANERMNIQIDDTIRAVAATGLIDPAHPDLARLDAKGRAAVQSLFDFDMRAILITSVRRDDARCAALIAAKIAGHKVVVVSQQTMSWYAAARQCGLTSTSDPDDHAADVLIVRANAAVDQAVAKDRRNHVLLFENVESVEVSPGLVTHIASEYRKAIIIAPHDHSILTIMQLTELLFPTRPSININNTYAARNKGIDKEVFHALLNVVVDLIK